MSVEGGHLWADNTRGNGPALVLLHPGWGDSSIWLPLLERLPPHYRVVRYDTRGFGKSPAPAAPFSQLGDLAAVLDDRGLDRVVLVGHSGGAGTAIGLALAAPARVRGMLLLAAGVPDIHGRQTILTSGSLTSSTRLGTGMGWPTWACGPGQLPAPTKPRKPKSAGQLMPSSGSATMSGPTRPHTPGWPRSRYRPW